VWLGSCHLDRIEIEVTIPAAGIVTIDVYDGMDTSTGRVAQNPTSPNHRNRVTMSGGIGALTGTLGELDPYLATPFNFTVQTNLRKAFTKSYLVAAAAPALPAKFDIDADFPIGCLIVVSASASITATAVAGLPEYPGLSQLHVNQGMGAL
jgi:hypothetical protein